MSPSFLSLARSMDGGKKKKTWPSFLASKEKKKNGVYETDVRVVHRLARAGRPLASTADDLESEGWMSGGFDVNAVGQFSLLYPV